jgi:hypothetical protein
MIRTSESIEKVYLGERVCINILAPSLRMDNINYLSIVSRGTAPIHIRAQWRSRYVSGEAIAEHQCALWVLRPCSSPPSVNRLRRMLLPMLRQRSPAYLYIP